jgi:outer membrane protein assembly factor BamD
MTAEDTYNLGERYLKRGYYLKALEQFNRVRTYFRDDPYALKAEIAIADMHFQKDEWDAARIAYEDFLKEHPRYPGLDYVLYRLGMVNYKKGPLIPDRDQAWTKAAVNTWSTFTLRFPQSTYRPEVEKLLKRSRDRLARKEWIIARFYDQRHAPVAVEGRILDMLRQYPDSPDAPRALALLGKAYAEEGNWDMATAAMQKLQEQYPGNSAIGTLKRSIILARLRKHAPTEESAPATGSPEAGG